MNPEFTSLVDMEELQVAIETVTADPSLLKEYEVLLVVCT